MTKPKSVLQELAADMQLLRESIDANTKLEPTLIKEVEQAEIALMRVRRNLEDSQALLAAQHEKLRRDANRMHTLIELALDPV